MKEPPELVPVYGSSPTTAPRSLPREFGFQPPPASVLSGHKADYTWDNDEIGLDEFRTGSFVIDFVNAKTNKLQCMVTGDAVIVKDEKDLKDNLEVGIKKMFKKIAD